MDSERPRSKPYWGRLFLCLAPFYLFGAPGTEPGAIRGTTAFDAIVFLVLGLRWEALPVRN